MQSDFLYSSTLQYKVKALQKRVEELENGEAVKKMQAASQRQKSYYEKKLAEKDKEIQKLRADLRKYQNKWFEVFEDVQAEAERSVKAAQKRASRIEQQASKTQENNQKLREKLRLKSEELVKERARALDEKEKAEKLKAQLNQNFQNSSLASSQTPFRPKVPNNREKTERSRGAQPGHAHHPRKKFMQGIKSVLIPAPPEIEQNPDYYRQKGKSAEIHKQVVSIRLLVDVTDYYAYVYRNRKTRGRYHAPFPANTRLEVNYDESVKALVFLMKDRLNVAENKIREFLYEMTDGQLCLSRGLINGIEEEYAAKSEEERNEICARLLSCDTMYTDMTMVRMNGKLKNVVACTNGTDILYSFRDKKGDKGVEGTPVAAYTNTLVHDHDKTWYHYGGAHAECNEHHLRYLKGAMENEPKLTWHGQMRKLLQEMNQKRESAKERKLAPEEVERLEARYMEILDLADKEYKDNPPSQYYRKGYNLAREFREYKESILYFLTHPEVDFTNNKSERACRKIKRHIAVSGTFRGDTNKSGEAYCNAMGVMESQRAKGKNIYQSSKEIFKRNSPYKKS